jgi:hypothetical protein
MSSFSAIFLMVGLLLAGCAIGLQRHKRVGVLVEVVAGQVFIGMGCIVLLFLSALTQFGPAPPRLDQILWALAVPLLPVTLIGIALIAVGYGLLWFVMKDAIGSGNTDEQERPHTGLPANE